MDLICKVTNYKRLNNTLNQKKTKGWQLFAKSQKVASFSFSPTMHRSAFTGHTAPPYACKDFLELRLTPCNTFPYAWGCEKAV